MDEGQAEELMIDIARERYEDVVDLFKVAIKKMSRGTIIDRYMWYEALCKAALYEFGGDELARIITSAKRVEKSNEKI